MEFLGWTAAAVLFVVVVVIALLHRRAVTAFGHERTDLEKRSRLDSDAARSQAEETA